MRIVSSSTETPGLPDLRAAKTLAVDLFLVSSINVREICILKYFLDYFMNDAVGVHCNRNTRTINSTPSKSESSGL